MAGMSASCLHKAQEDKSCCSMESILSKRWKFNAFELSEEQTIDFATAIFLQCRVVHTKGVPVDTLRKLSDGFLSTYGLQPFHNRYHGLDVMNRVRLVLEAEEVRKWFDDLEVFAILCAAIAHDAGHPGHNNCFEIATKSEKAQKFGPDSILEKYHVQEGTKVLYDLGLLDYFTVEEQRRFTDFFRNCIMATDLAKSFQLRETVRQHLGRGICKCEMTDENKLLLAAMVVHACDIGAQCAPPHVAQEFGKACLEEFNDQILKEHGLGLTSTFCKEKLRDFRNCQAFFMETFVMPSWTLLAYVTGALSAPIRYMKSNHQSYLSNEFPVTELPEKPLSFSRAIESNPCK